MLTYHFFPLNNMNAPSANIYLSRRHSPEDGDLLVSRDIAETATIRWVAQYTFTSYEQVRAEWLTFAWVREHCDYRSLYPEHSSHGSESVSFCYPWKKHGRCIREGITVGLHFFQTAMSCMAGLSLKKRPINHIAHISNKSIIVQSLKQFPVGTLFYLNIHSEQVFFDTMIIRMVMRCTLTCM